MKKRRLLPNLKTIGLLLLAANVSSQRSGLPVGHEFIHANDIKAAIGQGGLNFRISSGDGYSVPYRGYGSPGTIYSTAVWISAENENGKIFSSYETNGSERNYRPGPLSVNETPLSSPEMENWYRIFKVTGTEILAHIQDASDGTVDRPLESIFGWPGEGNKHFENIHGFAVKYGPEGGAYFVEVPGSVNGIYEPELGEYPHVETLSPDIIPGEITWVVYNNANQQQWWNVPDSTMTVEIQQTAYSFNCPGGLLYENLFFDYKVISRTRQNLTNFKFGLFMIPEIGCAFDDFLGCDPKRNTFYGYNADDYDGVIDNQGCPLGFRTYRDQPPVQTITFLNHRMNTFMTHYLGDIGPEPEPGTKLPFYWGEVYENMNGRWRDSIPLTKGGNGYNPMSIDTTRFAFPDNPNLPDGWSMYGEELRPTNISCLGVSATSLAPGTSKIFTIALGYHNHPDSNFLTNVNYALKRVDSLQILYDRGELGCQADLCSCECVWPGDANSDGRVDYLDAVNIIQAIGDTGSPRPAAYPFAPRKVNNWTFSRFQNINSKYADVDGNGEVDNRDLNLLYEYLGQANYCVGDPLENCAEGEEVYLEFANWGTDFPTSFSRGKIKVRNLDDFWGVSFKIKYDPELFDFSYSRNSAKWKDKSLNAIEFYPFWNDRTRKDQQFVFFNDARIDAAPNSYLDATVADFTIVPQGLPSKYPDSFATIKICDFTVYYTDGTSEFFPSRAAKFLLPDSVVSSTRSFTRVPGLVKVYPNPGYGQYTVESNYSVERVDVFNAQGQWIRSVKGNEVNIQDNRKGIYFFKIYGSSGELGFSKVILH